MKVRTRYAPSPTGRMHVGNLRTALYAYLIAKHEGGDFLLRIEDTDQERYVEGAVDIIYRTLEETGLVHDEGPDKDGGCGPYVQSERQASGIYMEYAKKLVEKGEAYYCFCTPERLETLRKTVNGEEIMTYDKHCLHLSKEEVEANLAAGKPFVIRQNNPTEGTTTFHDEIYGDITVDNSELDDMVLINQVLSIPFVVVCLTLAIRCLLLRSVCIAKVKTDDYKRNRQHLIDQDHIIQFRVIYSNIPIDLIMESSGSLSRVILTDNKWLTGSQICFHFLFRKMQTVLIISHDLLTVYSLS